MQEPLTLSESLQKPEEIFIIDKFRRRVKTEEPKVSSYQNIES
jgi:hypothetical protein